MKARFRPLPPGIPLLMFTSTLMYIGFYALIPYMTYHMTHSLLLTPLVVGLVLSTRQLSQQGFTWLTGPVADRIGYRGMMSIGMALRGIGFAGFGLFSSLPLLFASALLAGFGGALFEPPRDAALSTLTPAEERGRIFSIERVLGNVGIALSAVLGGVLISFDFMWLSVLCGVSYVGAALLIYWKLPDVNVQAKRPVPYREMLGTVIQDRFFLKFVLCTVGYYFLYLQTYLTLPLQAVKLTGDVRAISTINLTLACIIIVCQYPVNRLMTRLPLLTAIQLGLFLMGVGVIVLGTAHSLPVFVLGVMLFSLGIMIVEPANFEFTAKLAKREMTATYFGFSSLAIAIGGSLSQTSSGWLLQIGPEIGFPNLIWWISATVALLSIYGLSRLHTRQQKEALSF